ncbi:MAG: DUF4167 domain-containing protein [Kiloniellales bacterium]
MRQGSSGRRPRGRPHRKQHLPSRSQTFDSSGPEGRVRGNAHQVYEKYLALARDATASGDRIAAEGFYQFAEHYYRMVNDSTDPHSDGQRRFDQTREGMPPRGDYAYAGDGSPHQPAAARGNGAAPGGEAAGGRAESEATSAPVDNADAASEPRGEAGPRRRGLRRRKPANGNGAAPSDDEGDSQELASSDSDKDIACP